MGSGDQDWMRRALSLARRALGRTSPNPAVGAVLVRNGEMVGWGATHRAGGPHAEVVALRRAGEFARGATLYVTLEPCSHYGRTPPCCDALIRAGVARVVCAVQDPSPHVHGTGLARLRDAGIQVEVGLFAEEARRLNEAFFTYIECGRPFVLLKYAISLDGKTATRTGDSRWISSEASRRHVHGLRRVYDAVMCGVGTVLADDPQLTPRPRGRARVGFPWRVVVDSHARTPVTASILKEARRSRVLIATTDQAPLDRVRALEAAGAQVKLLPAADGRVDVGALLAELGRMEITSLLLEGGGELAAAFLQRGLVDKLLAFVAPVLVGGRAAPSPVMGEGVAKMADAVRLERVRVRRFGEDVAIEAYPVRVNVCVRAEGSEG